MNLIARLRKAVSGIDNPLARIILFGLGKTALWTPADYTALSKAGYENCVTLYACVNYICRAAAGIEWTATVGKKDAPDHAILKLLGRPNDAEGRRAFIFRSFASLLISGNRYILAGRIGKQPPLALWCPRPDLMTIVPGGGRGQIVDHYEFGKTSDPLKIDPSLVLHSKLFHPTENFYGLSPLSVASHAVDISNMANEWNMRLLQNDMRPPGALSTDGKLDDAQFIRLKDMMKSEWQGYENAGQPMLLEGGLKWVNFMLTAKEMDWLNTTKVTKRDICTVYNLDPCLVGDSEYATYSNKIEARKGAYEDVIIPLMEEFCDDLNAWLAPMYSDGLVLGINKDKIAALQESREKLFSYLNGAWWLRVDELRKLTGQDPVGGVEGETIFVPLGKIPLEQAAAEPEPDPEPAPAAEPPADDPNAQGDPDEDPEDVDEPEAGDEGKDSKVGAGKAAPQVKSFWAAPERKERLWKSFEGRVKTREKSFEQIAKAYIKAQAEAVSQRAGRLGSLSGLYGTDIFSVKDEAKRYSKAFSAWYVDHFIRAGNAGMRASKGELFDDAEFKALAWKDDPKKPTSWVFTMTPEQDAELKDMIFNSGTKVGETTLEVINKLIRKANVENWSVGKFAQEIGDKVADFAPWRSRLWARTESAKVDNYGQTEGYKQTEFVEKKAWMCSFVPDSRETHKEADGQEVALDEDFIVGGEALAYPGDPKGSPENVCNELCTTYPVVPES
ncbi:MAG: phage portal protein [Acidobacteriota bacterium]